MSKGKYQSSRHRRSPKTLAALLAVVLTLTCVVGGTLAWLTANTTPVTNTFTVGNINITLAEDTTDYKMIPGANILKDPMVTVLKDSEESWVFVKVEESTNLDTFIDYEVRNGKEHDEVNGTYWTELNNGSGVYYCKVSALTATGDQNVVLPVLACMDSTHTNCEGCVKVKTTVTKDMMDALDGIDANNSTDSNAAQAEVAARPTLTFTAYAIQTLGFENDVAAAWAEVSKTPSTT